MKKQKEMHLVVQALTMVFQFGLNMLVSIFLCTLFGDWLGKRIGADWLAIPFFFIGAIAGGQNIYRMIKRLFYASKSK